MSNESFFPEGYAPPQSKSSYTKFDVGETRIRILSKAIAGMEFWANENGKRKPVRYRKGQEPTDIAQVKQTFEPDRSGRYGKDFVAFTIYNYRTEQIEVCELTQVSIIRPLFELARDEDWGNPSGYDVKINKKIDGDRTEYSVTPVPLKPVSDTVAEAYMETPVRLEALFEGEDPFDVPTDYKSDDLPF